MVPPQTHRGNKCTSPDLDTSTATPHKSPPVEPNFSMPIQQLKKLVPNSPFHKYCEFHHLNNHTNLESFNYCSPRQYDKLYLDIFVVTQPRRYSDKFIVVQMELSQMRYVVKGAIFNGRNTVEAKTQSEKKSNKKTH